MSVQKAVKAIQKLYPIKYSETAWDNTGLLVDASSLISETTPIRILLTIDLTRRVVDEAIAKKVGLIVAYHPFIFKGIKQIEPLNNPQHDSLIRLISKGISVYSPHTAVDAVKGGVNDWLVEGIAAQDEIESVRVVNPSKDNEEIGVGRVVHLKQSKKLSQLVSQLKSHLGVGNLLVANGSTAPDEIRSVAICAGSGGSVFSNVKESIDLYLTGELSHHEALALKEQGKIVIAANHSNTERGYLTRMKELLGNELEGEELLISEEDSDPYVFA